MLNLSQFYPVNITTGLFVYTIDNNQDISGIKNFINKPTVNGTEVLLGVQNTTYSNLKNLKDSNQLISGQFYRISDFHLTWWNQSLNDTTVKSGLSPEPLIVFAISSSGISHEAKSELYPQDTIYYDIDATSSNSWGTINSNTPISNFKGWIYRRIDHKLNIDIPWDWRHITVNCCRPDMSFIPLYSAANTYNLYSVVKNGIGKLYYSLKDNNFNLSLTNSSHWQPVSNFIEASTYFVTEEGGYAFRAYKGTNTLVVLPVDQTTRIQQPTFTSSLTSQGIFELSNCKNIKIKNGHSNVFLGSNIISNNIENGFSFNTIANDFRRNIIGNDFFINTIGSNFHTNTIGNEFYFNTISSNFYYNTTQNNFINNTIAHDFYSNTVGSIFQYNLIGQNFNRNKIATSFYLNTIGNSFNVNTIGNSFYSSIIGNNFRQNTLEDNLTIGNVTGATHVYNAYNTRLFKNSNQTVRLSYFNSSDQLIITDPTA